MHPEYLEDELDGLSDAQERVLSRDSFLLPISQLFSKGPLTVDVDDRVDLAIAKMRETEYGAVVVTREGRVAGLLTERELICNVVGVIAGYESCKVHTVMLGDPVTLRPEDPILYALHNMQAGGYRHIPIVDAAQRPVSVVSLKDVLRFLLSYFAADVHNLTPEPYRGEVPREGA
jgi:CBS domain-containing protein